MLHHLGRFLAGEAGVGEVREAHDGLVALRAAAHREGPAACAARDLQEYPGASRPHHRGERRSDRRLMETSRIGLWSAHF